MERFAGQPGPQTDALLCAAIEELFFGGARGGGKTAFLLGDYCADAAIGAPWRGLLLRRSFPELEEVMRQAADIIPACWPGSEYFKAEKTWRLPSGAELRLRSLETEEDAAKLQGHSFSWIGWDELGQFPDDGAYKKLMACLRSAEAVPHKRIRATGNPGGPGHGWIRRRFIDPAPLGYEVITDPVTRMRRIYIPSRVTDNAILLARDPSYIDRLRGVGSPELVRSWLEGDWDAIIGSYFPEWGRQHIRAPFAVPRHWLKFRALDWGSARPACLLWCAMSDGDVTNIPAGCMVVYRELYTASEPNVGLRLTVDEVAKQARELEFADGDIGYSVADPACFASDGGPSIAERFADQRVFFRPADNRRVGKTGAMAGWDLVRQRLRGEDGIPMLAVFPTCTNLIRTLPTMQHDPKRPEDLDTTAEDHAADALRYACASRPWVAAMPRAPEDLNLELLWKHRARRQERARV